MSEVNLNEEPHLSRVEDYLADGYRIVDYLIDHNIQCERCERWFDDALDGFDYGRTGQWFCEECYNSGEYKEVLTWGT